MNIFIHSLLSGFAVSAAIGPVGILFIEQALKLGAKQAWPIALGALLANGIYGFVAAFGISIIANFLIQNIAPLKILGGLFLLYLAYEKLKNPSALKSATTRNEESLKLMGEVMLLTLANPVNIICFASIFASMVREKLYIWESLAMVLGISSGSLLLYVLLGVTVSCLKQRLSAARIACIKYVSTMLIGLFGLYSLIKGVQFFI
jgi:threonine/homoserine/homoserine lactone efflux protein